MPAEIIDGTSMATDILHQLHRECHGISGPIQTVTKALRPTLAILSLGEDPASQVYIRNKMKACQEVGITCITANLRKDSLIKAIDLLTSWANDPDIDGIIVQLPAPEWRQLVKLIPPDKDVDGLRSDSKFIPCTPKGILLMLDNATGFDLCGKHAVIVGRSNIVGRPMAKLLLDSDCTVTVCHSKTSDLKSLTSQADILISAAGQPGLIKADMVKEGAIVIDVGINRIDGKLKGDVDFDAVKEKASYITPVPGGVGPMTVAMLMENVCRAYEMHNPEL